MIEPATSGNRRRAYRVQPAGVDELDLAVLGERHQLIRGEVGDAAVGGARVCFDKRATATPWARGDRVELELSSKRYHYSGRLMAEIVSMSEAEHEQTLHLRFDDEALDFERRGQDLFAVLNRRATRRGGVHDPGHDFMARVSLSSGPHALSSYPANIRNISNYGVSLTVDAPTHALLEREDRLTLTLRLPEQERDSTIACVVRHRCAHPAGFLYGCEYDWSATTDPLGVVEDLVAYVLENAED